MNKPPIINMPSAVELAACEYQRNLHHLAEIFADLGIYIQEMSVEEPQLCEVNFQDPNRPWVDKATELRATGLIKVGMSKTDAGEAVFKFKQASIALAKEKADAALREEHEDLRELWEIYEATKTLKLQDQVDDLDKVQCASMRIPQVRYNP